MNLGKSMVRLGATVAVSSAVVLGSALSASAAVSKTHWVAPNDPYVLTSQANGHTFHVLFGYTTKKQVPAYYTCIGLKPGSCQPVYAKWEVRYSRASDGKVLFDRKMSNYKSEAIEVVLEHQLKQHHMANRVPSSSWMTAQFNKIMNMTEQQASYVAQHTTGY